MWSSADSFRKHTYECERCHRTKLIENRVCFLEECDSEALSLRKDDTLEIKADVKKDEDEYLWRAGDTIESTEDEVFAVVEDTIDAYPEMSAREALDLVLPTVCPKSLIDEDTDDMLRMEAFCREYHLPPLGNTPYPRYPLKLVRAFGIITGTRELYQLRDMQEKLRENKAKVK